MKKCLTTLSRSKCKYFLFHGGRSCDIHNNDILIADIEDLQEIGVVLQSNHDYSRIPECIIMPSRVHAS